MSEQTIMVCIRVADAKEGEVAVSSTITNCSECDEPIWMSKASQDQMVETDARPVCIQCFKPPKDAEFMPPTKEVIKEILTHMKIVLEETKHEKDTTDRLRGPTREG